MTDWTSLFLKALTDLGADQVLVPGAKLREQVVKLGASEPQQFEDFLKAKSLKFGELLEEIQPGQDIEVFRKPGTDLYVGYKGASWPSVLPKTKWLLRHDVYEAVTRITDTPFYYIRERDEFTQNPDAKDEVIQLPKVTLDLLMQDRREFAGLQKVSEIKDSL